MPFNYRITKTVTTTSPAGYQRLFHGSSSCYATSFTGGIDFTKGGGFVWLTADLENARYHAGIAEFTHLSSGGLPGQMIVALDLPSSVIESFQLQKPIPWLVQWAQGFQFSSECSTVFHAEMKNVEITFEE
jgi:hypothetical protein